MLQNIIKKPKKTYPHEPDYIIPVAPGELLREKLEEMEMTTEQFAEQAGWTVEAVELFYAGRLPLEPAFAEVMEKITKMKKDFMIRFEKRYRDDLIKAAEKYSFKKNRLAKTG
jgi:plasmid maintenance system antidote protein VapI